MACDRIGAAPANARLAAQSRGGGSAARLRRRPRSGGGEKTGAGTSAENAKRATNGGGQRVHSRSPEVHSGVQRSAKGVAEKFDFAEHSY